MIPLNSREPPQQILNNMFEYSNGQLYRKSTGVVAGFLSNGYIRCSITYLSVKKQYAVHRLIWIIFNGTIPDGFLIDHIDRNKTNNQIENLRLSTLDLNAGNRKDHHELRGVSRADSVSEKYTARIGHGNNRKYLGTFNTKEEASAAYSKEAKLRYGDFYNED